MSFIEIKDLHKKYKDNVVLNGINLSIEKGNVIGIIGPSGTGKSTILRCINQLEVPEKGSIVINGKEIDLSNKKNKKDILELRQNTGMVFQSFNLFERKTALENVEEGLIVVQKKSKEEAKKAAPLSPRAVPDLVAMEQASRRCVPGVTLCHRSFGPGKLISRSGDIISVRFADGAERRFSLSAALRLGQFQLSEQE